jgi:hypothetical protein
MTMAARLTQFKADLANLTVSDVQDAVNFNAWLDSYGTYVMSGGDRPTHKPPTA